MDVKLSIGGEDVGMSKSIKEVRKDEGGASMELMENKMDSLEEEQIWKSRRERMNNALAAAQATGGQDPAETYAAARKLADVIKGADVEMFISAIEELPNQTDLSAIFNFLGLWSGSLLHIAAAANKDDILRLLLAYVSDHFIAAQNEWGDTPLHMAGRAGGLSAVQMLINRASNLPNVMDKNRILRMQNKHGNTALHEAVCNSHVDVVRLLLSEDLDSVYLKNKAEKSPLYLALDAKDSAIHEALFSLSLEPSRIEGLPPIHGVIMHNEYDLFVKISEWNKKLFAVTDSREGNVFHLIPYLNGPFLPAFEYLVRERDMNGDLPIHIAAKVGNVKLIEELYPVSQLPNGQGQTVLHIAAKYGKASAVRQVLRNPDLGEHINVVDYAGNTPLHLAAMHSQPAALIHLLLDKRILLTVTNNKCLTAFDIAIECVARKPTIRNQLAYLMLLGSDIWEDRPFSRDSLIHRPEALDKRFVRSGKNMPNRDNVRDLINSRMVVATLVATVTFAAGFAVPGGFNGSDTASKDDRGMATMLDNRMFQAFVICNTIAMFCSITAVANLIWARLDDMDIVLTAFDRTTLPLKIALPAMSIAFLTGVTLTVGKLSWLANIIFYLGLLFLLIISGAKLLEQPPVFMILWGPTRRQTVWLIRAYIYLCGVDTDISDDAEEDGTTSETSASRPTDGAGQSKTDDSATAKCGNAPHPPSR